ncbi:exonuclease sbcCD subunit D [Anaerobacillus arseniciselenatis]|uniref:Nuclease SbcCD subunit D n=1 Tax=Anaerobacillus arseniciselenatis TaxID=85682 RepID=A0A1S2LTT7_9BACI|nr:exonuclease SbcCD subunit D [Anaerobacillus arseniciselenatis]OIJ15734.1 exonuclease sbcCD subunit D [Anaerobacillus arseniciselenatis]
MKFIHTADWHLGKLVHGIHMTDDQKSMLQQFIKVVEEEKPDAVIIAGDLYDRSVPPTKAVDLLHDVLYTITTELNTPVLAISGNHDSAERIHFGNQLFRKSDLYIEGKPTLNPKAVQIKGVNFHLIPYSDPGTIRYLYDDDSIVNHEEAMKRIVASLEESMNPNEANVFVGHAFVLGGMQSDSERTLSVGGSECVNADVFSPFDYTALGHLHSPSAINHPTVHYSGSLMKYSFSEAKQNKSISIVTMEENGQFNVEYKSLVPERDMRIVEGHLDELLDVSFYQSQQVEDYLKISLLDEGALIDPIGKLRSVYPNVLHLERKIEQKDAKKTSQFHIDTNNGRDTIHLFNDFYQEMTTNSFTDEKKEVISAIINNVGANKGGGCK